MDSVLEACPSCIRAKSNMLALLLILLMIPIIIEGINIPLPKDIENYICTVDDGVLIKGNCVPVMR